VEQEERLPIQIIMEELVVERVVVVMQLETQAVPTLVQLVEREELGVMVETVEKVEMTQRLVQTEQHQVEGVGVQVGQLVQVGEELLDIYCLSGRYPKQAPHFYLI
jgi:hypothetical protein